MTREERIEELERMLVKLPEIMSPLKVSRNTTTDAVINANNLNADVSWWSWFVTYHFNQQEYVKDGAGYTY